MTRWNSQGVAGGLPLIGQADSVDEWLNLAEAYRRVAIRALEDPFTTSVAWANAGFACECLFKAAIMAKEGLNGWPDKQQRKDLHTHDIRSLAKTLGWVVSPVDEVAPAWAVVVQWRMEHRYKSGNLPIAVAESLVDAIFSNKGVAIWIARTYLKSRLKQVENTMIS